MEIDEALVERLAQLIHTQYLGRQAAAASRRTSPARPPTSTATPVDATAGRPAKAVDEATATGQSTTATGTGKASKPAATGRPTKATGKPSKAAGAGSNTRAARVAAGRAAKVGSAAGPAGLPRWSELDDGMRAASRGQARDIMVKLDRIGCSVEPGPPIAPFTFSSDELDLLAKEEHVRWVRERTDAGWVPGPARDDARKVHPSLVGWDALDDIERDKDRDAVRDIPIVLAAAGLHVVRTPAS